MKITTTEFDSNYHSSKKAGNTLHGFYELHNIDVYNQIIIDDYELDAIYQTGESYLYNDYGCPNPELELSESGGTDDALLLIDQLYCIDFDNDEYIIEVLAKVNDCCDKIDSVKKLYAVYEALNENKPLLHEHID